MEEVNTVDDTNLNLEQQVQHIEKENDDMKSLYLIRHSESVNNSDMREAYDGLVSLGRLRLPTLASVQSTVSLLGIRMNTDLSPRGKLMVKMQREKIDGKHFLKKHKIDLVLHSHLIRAKRSCYGLFADNDEILSTEGNLMGKIDQISFVNGDEPNPVENNIEEEQQGEKLSSIPVIEHDSFYEKNLPEYFDPFQIYRRIDEVKSWLLKRKEKRIVIVGHSIFFQLFLQSETKMENCEISQVTLNQDGSCTDFEILFPGGLSLVENSNNDNNFHND